MTETPKCPYCGTEMELKYVCGEYFCLCAACEATSPMGTSKEAALSVALHRAEPEMRPLTLEEVMGLGKDDDSIVYIESRRLGECGGGIRQKLALLAPEAYAGTDGGREMGGMSHENPDSV